MHEVLGISDQWEGAERAEVTISLTSLNTTSYIAMNHGTSFAFSERIIRNKEKREGEEGEEGEEEEEEGRERYTFTKIVE